jgi:hypothetical protein
MNEDGEISHARDTITGDTITDPEPEDDAVSPIGDVGQPENRSLPHREEDFDDDEFEEEDFDEDLEEISKSCPKCDQKVFIFGECGGRCSHCELELNLDEEGNLHIELVCPNCEEVFSTSEFQQSGDNLLVECPFCEESFFAGDDLKDLGSGVEENDEDDPIDEVE